jgi:hypothetical protein
LLPFHCSKNAFENLYTAAISPAIKMVLAENPDADALEIDYRRSSLGIGLR